MRGHWIRSRHILLICELNDNQMNKSFDLYKERCRLVLGPCTIPDSALTLLHMISCSLAGVVVLSQHPPWRVSIHFLKKKTRFENKYGNARSYNTKCLLNSLSASLLLNIFLSFEVGIAHAIANFK